MEVHHFHRIEDFEQMRGDFEQAFAADPFASPFLSWPWLRAWCDVSPYPWSFLALRRNASSPWTGFLPISIRGSPNKLRVDQVREIHMGGAPGADYTGFVCASGFEQPMMIALARYFATQLSWDRIRFMEVNDPRLDLLLAEFNHGAMRIQDHQGACCPYIPLRESFEEYLSRDVSYESRKSLRKKMRMIERDCRVTHLDSSNHRQQIDALIALADRRNRTRPNVVAPLFRPLFERCAAAGLASILVIWRGQEPVASLGSFIDRKANSIGTYVTGFDDRFAEYSPGRVVNALAIKHAIEQNFAVLDFLRGDEPYKLQFGALRRHIRNVTIVRRGVSTATRMAVHRVRKALHF